MLTQLLLLQATKQATYLSGNIRITIVAVENK
jgi:hypothetical protein